MIKELINLSNYNLIVNDPHESVYIKFKRTLKVYLLLLLGLIVVGMVILATDYMVKNFFHLKSLISINKENIENFILKDGKLKGYLMACILVPIFEEFLFRIWLDLKKNNIAIFFATVVFLVSASIKPIAIPPHVGLLIRIILAAITFFIAKYAMTGRTYQISIYQKQLIIASIILFSLAHISNYSPIYWKIIYLYPIYVLPQFIMGAGLTYTRLKSGIFWSIFLHCLINSVAILLHFHK